MGGPSMEAHRAARWRIHPCHIGLIFVVLVCGLAPIEGAATTEPYDESTPAALVMEEADREMKLPGWREMRHLQASSEQAAPRDSEEFTESVTADSDATRGTDRLLKVFTRTLVKVNRNKIRRVAKPYRLASELKQKKRRKAAEIRNKKAEARRKKKAMQRREKARKRRGVNLEKHTKHLLADQWKKQHNAAVKKQQKQMQKARRMERRKKHWDKNAKKTAALLHKQADKDLTRVMHGKRPTAQTRRIHRSTRRAKTKRLAKKAKHSSSRGRKSAQRKSERLQHFGDSGHKLTSAEIRRAVAAALRRMSSGAGQRKAQAALHRLRSHRKHTIRKILNRKGHHHHNAFAKMVKTVVKRTKRAKKAKHKHVKKTKHGSKKAKKQSRKKSQKKETLKRPKKKTVQKKKIVKWWKKKKVQKKKTLKRSKKVHKQKEKVRAQRTKQLTKVVKHPKLSDAKRKLDHEIISKLFKNHAQRTRYAERKAKRKAKAAKLKKTIRFKKRASAKVTWTAREAKQK